MSDQQQPDWGRWAIIGIIILLFVVSMIVANRSHDPTSNQIGPNCSASGNC